MSAQSISIWRERHRFCADGLPIKDREEAGFVLREHASHKCFRFYAALDCVSDVTA